MTLKPPYQPSWIDKTLEWVDRLPFSGLTFIALLYAFCVLAVHSALWLEGFLSLGEFDTTLFFDLLWIPLGLGYIYYLEKAAHQAITDFTPAMELPRAEAEAVTYRFITLPAFPVLALTLIGFVLGVLTLLNLPFQYGSESGASISHIFLAVLSGGGYGFLPIWFYAAYRNVTQINELYKQVKKPNLFNLYPLQSLSRVTLFIAAFMVLVVNVNLALELFLGTQTQSSGDVIAVYIFGLTIALVVFVVPLLGMRRKIEAEKRALLAENAHQIENLRFSLQKELRRKKLQNISELEKALSALFALRANILAVPALPWTPGTFRNFATAVVLPLVIWLAQRLLTPLF